ncbi:MAG: hypothetical protein IJ424_01345 [Oscillospiraceae bacterium]|nr:hypothetical protein [Oscillospiraceae bacterium]
MKKILSLALAAMLVLALAVNCFAAYDAPVSLGLYVGGWGADVTVDVDKPGVYTIVFDGEERSFDWLIIKTSTGNQENEPTSIPEGTIISITELKIDGVSYTFDGGNATWDYTVGAEGKIEMKPWLNPAFGGADHIDNNPKTGSKIEVTLTVDAANITEDAPVEEEVETPVEEEPVEEAPTTEAPVDEAPADEAPAETGLALAVVPMIVALAAVVLSKKN